MQENTDIVILSMHRWAKLTGIVQHGGMSYSWDACQGRGKQTCRQHNAKQ